jgi:hypothetical protein
MSYEFYKVMHLTGLFMIFSGIGAYFVGGASAVDRQFSGKKMAGLLHGVGLLVALVSGFGLLARLDLMGTMPGWVIGKLVIWLSLGGVIAFAMRKPQLYKAGWLATLVLGAAAAYLARYKPF